MKTAVLPPPPVGLEQLARSATRTSICSRSERKGWGGECAKHNSPLPPWGRGRRGWGLSAYLADKLTAAFTYTLSAQAYVKPIRKLLLSLALLAAPAFALDLKPLETGGSYASTTYKNVRYGIYQADPAQVSLHWKTTDGSAYANLATLKHSLEHSGRRVAFLMNAGIYSQDDTPAGLWIERGQTLVPLNRKNGKGNFHIQPNGVFYIERGKARIQTSAAYHIGGHHPDWALQSGPMLLLDGKINPRFVKDLSSPHKRNAVCTTADGRLYFILTEDYDPGSEWPSFHRYAEALQHLGCQQALYLDGTLSDWYLPGIAGTFHWKHYVGIIAVTTPETP